MVDKRFIDFPIAPSSIDPSRISVPVWNELGASGDRTQRILLSRLISTIEVSADSTGIFIAIAGLSPVRLMTFGGGLNFNPSTRVLSIASAPSPTPNPSPTPAPSPTPTPSFNTLITTTDTTNGNASNGVTFLGSMGDQFSFDAISSGGASPMTMFIAIGNTSNIVGSVTFFDRYANQRFIYRRASTGITYNGVTNVFANNATIVLS